MARLVKRIRIMPYDDGMAKLIKELEKDTSMPIVTKGVGKKKGNTCMIHITEPASLWCPVCGVRLCSKCAFIHKVISTHHEANAEQLSISRTPTMMPS